MLDSYLMKWSLYVLKTYITTSVVLAAQLFTSRIKIKKYFVISQFCSKLNLTIKFD